jgi:hypothetical protein
MAHSDGPPVSTLDDVLEGVRLVLSTAGYLRTGNHPPGIEWLVGERYEQSEGAPPRVLVLVGEDGSVGGPGAVDAGYVAGVTERCTMLLWGDETTADGDRYRAAKQIAVTVVNALRLVAPGRLAGLTLRRPYKTDLLTYGEEYRLTFSYFWRVPRVAAIWSVPVTPISPPDPMRPNGDTGLDFTLTPTVNGSR